MTCKIAVVTGTRAEYGLLYWLTKAIQNDNEMDLQVVVTGAHLSPEFGSTVNDIEKDGFNVDWKVHMLLSSDSSVAVTKSLGLCIIGFADAFYHLKPDVVVLLGDRYEIFGVAQAAFLARIPIVHLHGGEVTLGAYDNAFRHSITQMSALHFVARKEYQERVINMGADPSNVFLTGPMCLDAMANMELPNKKELECDLGICLDSPLFIVTYHPETLSNLSSEDQIDELLSALDCFRDATLVVTGANADTDGRIINKKMLEFCEALPGKRLFNLSLGMKRYWGLLKIADLMVGNSSSGIIEAPLLGVKVLNVGDRQKNRINDQLVSNCPCNRINISNEITCLLKSPFKKGSRDVLEFSEPSQKILPAIKKYLKVKK